MGIRQFTNTYRQFRLINSPSMFLVCGRRRAMHVQGEHEKLHSKIRKKQKKNTKLCFPSEVDIISLKTEHLNSCYTCMSQEIWIYLHFGLCSSSRKRLRRCSAVLVYQHQVALCKVQRWYFWQLVVTLDTYSQLQSKEFERLSVIWVMWGWECC